VDDSIARWDNFEIFEGFLTPFQKCKSLLISLEFQSLVFLQGLLSSSMVDHNRMINNQFNRTKWIDYLGILTHSFDSVSHGSEIDHCWNSSEILQNNSGGLKGNLDLLMLGLIPVENILGSLLSEHKLVVISQSIFQQNSNGIRKALYSFIL
jgi:hypothetical protein